MRQALGAAPWSVGDGMGKGGRQVVPAPLLAGPSSVIDSLQDPRTLIWMNYTLLTLGPPPGQGDGPWQDTYYSNHSKAQAALAPLR